MAEMSDDDILAELGVSLETKKVRARTPREERIIAGFEDVLKFREEHGRAPEHGETHDIFERLYAVRLDRLRQLPESRELLADMDRFGLLDGGGESSPPPEALDDDALLAELGVGAGAGDDITQLRHVRSYEEKRSAEDIATRTPCADFSVFRPLFDQVQGELDSGVRQTRPFVKDAGFSKAVISKGEFFIVGGQLAYVADVGESFRAPNGETDARLRVIYSNGTESDLLLRSLQRGLYKDEGGRRVTEPAAGPLFAEPQPTDYEEYLPTGTLYVLQSQSSHPTVAANRHLVHKIGITGGDVEARIAGAADDPTYLLAPVDVVATYKLYEVNRKRLEALIHRVLGAVRFNIEIADRFGKPVRPREWFLVPLPIIDELVARIGDGSIVGMTYDPSAASLVGDAAKD
jgi:hypothetical protein